jgi:hypothetical protein
MCESVEQIRRSGFGSGVDPRVAVHPESPGLDRSGGAFHLSGRCQPPVGFARVNVLVSFLVFRLAVVSSLVQFGARKVGFLYLGFPAWISLTGVHN